MLRQVVVERGEDHPVEPVPLQAAAPRRQAPVARPSIAKHIRVLSAELEPTTGPAVEAIPEADGSLDQGPRIGRAIGKGAGGKATGAGRDFAVAAGVVERGRAIANISSRLCPREDRNRTTG